MDSLYLAFGIKVLGFKNIRKRKQNFLQKIKDRKNKIKNNATKK